MVSSAMICKAPLQEYEPGLVKEDDNKESDKQEPITQEATLRDAITRGDKLPRN